jgi:hypothetical protein
MIDKLFHLPDEIPEYDNQLLFQFEDGSYFQFFYWAMSEDLFEKYLKNTRYRGPVIRWCYIKDLDKIK